MEIPFPSVPPKASEDEIERLGEEYANRLAELKPNAVLCQGEFTLCFCVVRKLQEKGITVLSACSERVTTEGKTETGTAKSSVFEFVRFRKYY